MYWSSNSSTTLTVQSIAATTVYVITVASPQRYAVRLARRPRPPHPQAREQAAPLLVTVEDRVMRWLARVAKRRATNPARRFALRSASLA